VRFFPTHTFEFTAILFLGQEVPGLLASLGKVFFAHNLGLELCTLANSTVSMTVACRRIGCHGFAFVLIAAL
jgi:hypothetical protein